MVLDVIGTWESVLIAMAEPGLTPEIQRTGMWVQAHVARGLHAASAANVSADMLEWYRTQFGAEAKHQAETEGGTDWDHLMARAADSPPGSRHVMFLPHMSGVNCPVVDERSLGAFVGLSNRATAGDVLRAMIEGLDYQFLDIVTALQSGLDVELDRFIAVGGATRNEFWMQNKADVIGRPIEVPDVEEATPLGAAILAGIGVGLYKDEEDAFVHVYKPGRTYEPDLELTSHYAEWFLVYQQIYSALKSVNHQLFDHFHLFQQ